MMKSCALMFSQKDEDSLQNVYTFIFGLVICIIDMKEVQALVHLLHRFMSPICFEQSLTCARNGRTKSLDYNPRVSVL